MLLLSVHTIFIIRDSISLKLARKGLWSAYFIIANVGCLARLPVKMYLCFQNKMAVE